MTDLLVRLSSRDITTHNFITSFSPALSFTDEEQWSVAIAEIFIPRLSRLVTIRTLFRSGEEMARWRFYYETSGVGTTTASIDQAVTEHAFDTLGDNVTKADILLAIYAQGFNDVIKAVKADSTIAKAYWKDSAGSLYQTFVWEGDNLVLKAPGSAAASDGYLRLSKKLFDLLGLVGYGNILSKYLYPRSKDNYDFKDKVTWRLANNNTELYLNGTVDWVFVNMKESPFINSRLIPLNHVDVRSDVVADSSKVFLHAVVPFGGVTIIPPIRDYRPLAKGSYSSIRLWISDAGKTTPISLNNAWHTDKTHVVLHFKKENLNLRGDYRREHPTMVF